MGQTGEKVSARSGQFLRTAKKRNRRAEGPAACFRAGERRGRGRTPRGERPNHPSKNLTNAHSSRPSDDFSVLSADNGFGERVKGDVFGEELFEHCAEDENPDTFVSGLVEGERDFEAASEGDRARSDHTADDGFGFDAKKAFDLAKRDAVFFGD